VLEKATKRAPADGEWAQEGGEMPIAAGASAADTELGTYETVLNDPEYAISYRVKVADGGGADAFLRPFAPAPVSLGITVQKAKLEAKITNRPADGKTKSQLVLTNTDPAAGCAVVAITAQPVEPAGIPAVQPTPPAAIGSKAESTSIELWNDRIGETKVTKWRLTVDCQFGATPQQTIFGDFDAQ
jgi:hypothetical protein